MRRDPSKTSEMMSRIKGKDTKIELALRRALYHRGYRYRKNVKSLPGSPDIVLTRYRICLFCDGDFFHGYDYVQIDNQLKTNRGFWKAKIKRNRERDRKVDQKLVAMGYLVLRFWEHEIDTDLEKVVKEIEMAIMKREREEKLR